MSLHFCCVMISSAASATVCSLPSRWQIYNWPMFRVVTIWLSYSVTVSLYVCVRPFSHHGNLVSRNNSVIRSKNISAHTHRWNKCPASCSFLGVCYWGTKPCFIWRKVETEKELCVSDTSCWSHCQA